MVGKVVRKVVTFGDTAVNRLKVIAKKLSTGDLSPGTVHAGPSSIKRDNTN